MKLKTLYGLPRKVVFAKKHLYLIKDQIQQLNFYTEKIQKKKHFYRQKWDFRCLEIL